jgi:hypothetical protein
MIFPKGEVVHRNLSTAFTDFPALLSTLKKGDFCGIIEIEFQGNKGVILVDSGEILNAETKVDTDSKRIIGQEAIETLLSNTNNKDGVINIYRLSHEWLILVANNLQDELIFKGLSTDFTHLDRLLLKLKEEKHNGFIEFLTKDSQAMGVLFLEGGEPVEMFTLPESGPSVFGRKSIPIFVENAIKQGAIFDVYRSHDKVLKKEREEVEAIERDEIKVQEQTEDLKELLTIFQDVLSKAEKMIDGASRKKGLFLELFKDSLIKKSEEFSFLDPFASEFEYRDGLIQFTGKIGTKDFARGMAECLASTLTHLKKELPKDKILPLKLKTGIETYLERHHEALKRLGVDGVLSSFFQ